MIFLTPFALALAVGAAMLLVALHFITRHRPPRVPLPTARFVPASAARITARSLRMSDPLLLVVRALVITAAALAVAGPMRSPQREPLVRVVLIDRSRALADAGEARDSVAAIARPGDVLIAVDSGARRLEWNEGGPPVALEREEVRGSLSVGLVAAFRAAAALHDRADSVEIVVVSPLVREQIDAATFELRALHKGRFRIVRPRAARSPVPRWPVELRASDGDPIASTLSLMPRPAAATPSADDAALEHYDVRIVRGALETSDSAWAAEQGSARVLVHWPADPSLLSLRIRPDTIGAVVGARAAVIATFERSAEPRHTGTVVARWGDGSPAATEWRAGDGGACTREVAVTVPATGDLVLRPGFAAFVAEMSWPCGGGAALELVADSLVEKLRGDGTLIAPAEWRREPRGRRSPWTPWLLAIALIGLLLEWPMRRRRGA